jgi:hypothetical protein
VLEEVADATGLLSVTFLPGSDPNGRVTLESSGEPIEVVVARALTGVPYAIEPSDDGGRIRHAVVVGRQRPAGAPAREERRQSVERSFDPEERAERVRQLAQMEDEALEKLESTDPAERAEGVEWADTSTVLGYEAVIERLANDPDGAVRAAAAESLASADVGAVRPLLGALADPDARVVMAALESLEMLGDESILPDLAPAFEHPDPSVRQRAREAEEFLK